MKGRVLEIGSGEGLFLAVASARGWHACGVEIEELAARYGRERWGLDIFCGPIASAPWPEQSFDLVYMSNVMEHLPSPLEMLSVCRRLLRPAGLLYVKTGNVDSCVFDALGAEWHYLDFHLHGHVAFYSPRSVTYALVQAGFPPDGVRVRTSGAHACRRRSPWHTVCYSLLDPWIRLRRRGDVLRVEARLGQE